MEPCLLTCTVRFAFWFSSISSFSFWQAFYCDGLASVPAIATLARNTGWCLFYYYFPYKFTSSVIKIKINYAIMSLLGHGWHSCLLVWFNPACVSFSACSSWKSFPGWPNSWRTLLAVWTKPRSLLTSSKHYPAFWLSPFLSVSPTFGVCSNRNVLVWNDWNVFSLTTALTLPIDSANKRRLRPISVREKSSTTTWLKPCRNVENPRDLFNLLLNLI